MNLKLVSSYKRVNQKLQSQYREPDWGWGFRVAVTLIAPLIWGYFMGMQTEAFWMTIAAQCVAFIDLKGSVEERIRLLLSAGILSILFAATGSLLGSFAIINILVMFVIGFLCGLFKNLGDRGAGLALSVYVFYILTSSTPILYSEDLFYRIKWVAFGSLWAVFTGLISFSFIKVGTPYRRSIAKIWKTVALLAETVGKGWDGLEKKSSIREIYLMEKEVRQVIDDSLYLFEETSEQVQDTQIQKYALTQSRKTASLISLYIIQIAENIEELSKAELSKRYTLQVFSLLRSLQQIGERMEVYLWTLRVEEKTIVKSRLKRLGKTMALIEEMPEMENPEIKDTILKIKVATERVEKLVNRSIELLEKSGEQRVIAAYSFAQTLYILHPKYLKSNLRQLFNFNSFTTKYAIRVGFSAMVGALVSWLFFPDHGYWIPLTAIIVAQPYFGATLTRGIERSLGTVAGILVGTGFLFFPYPEVTRILLVFSSAVFLIYYLRRKYSVAAFFITLMLVGLLGISNAIDTDIMITRILATITGSVLAIAAGFLLMPTWDSKQLPQFIADAFMANVNYFRNTFYYDYTDPWTRFKRKAETHNSNAFDSLTRSMSEPGRRNSKQNEDVFQLLTHNVRITRELNNFNNENEIEENKIPIKEKEKFIQLLHECDDAFREIGTAMRKNGNEFIEEKWLHVFPEKGFLIQTPSDVQFLYMEKLLTELKFIADSLDKKPS